MSDEERVIDFLRRGRTVGFIADAMGIPVQVVRKVAAHQRMLIGPDGVARSGQALDQTLVHEGVIKPTGEHAPPVVGADGWQALHAKGTQSGNPKARSLAEKLIQTVTLLRIELSAETERQKAWAAAEKEKSDALALVANLKKQLADARAAARKPLPSAKERPMLKDPGYDHAVVRAWAKTRPEFADRHLPGRYLPVDVVQAWKAAL